MAGPLERWNVEKKRFQKSYFFLNSPALNPPPPTPSLNGPAFKRRTFFLPKGSCKKKVIFLMAGPLRGGGGSRAIKENFHFICCYI